MMESVNAINAMLSLMISGCLLLCGTLGLSAYIATNVSMLDDIDCLAAVVYSYKGVDEISMSQHLERRLKATCLRTTDGQSERRF